jgi:hypothetical protein
MKKFWLSPVPKTCQLCDQVLGQSFVDGHLRVLGQWCIMCLPCHGVHGVGFGAGRGQRYDRQIDDRWLKTEG